MERSAGLIERGISFGRRRPPLQRGEFDSSPRHLRENLKVLDAMLEANSSDIRRRVRLTFGELVASWQLRFSGDGISVVMEVLPNAVRMNVHHPEQMLAPGEWDDLVSSAVADLVDDWGVDRRVAGGAWFEFQLRHSGHAFRVGSRVLLGS